MGMFNTDIIGVNGQQLDFGGGFFKIGEDGDGDVVTPRTDGHGNPKPVNAPVSYGDDYFVPEPYPPVKVPKMPTPYSKKHKTENPTPSPVSKPTERPTPRPSERPTPRPSERPTPRPTSRPTPDPTPYYPTQPKPYPRPRPPPAPETPRPTPAPTPIPTRNPTVSVIKSHGHSIDGQKTIIFILAQLFPKCLISFFSHSF